MAEAAFVGKMSGVDGDGRGGGSMSRLPLIVAVLAAAFALWWLFNSDLGTEEANVPLTVDEPDEAPPEDWMLEKPTMGGVYGGKVVDLEGNPVPGAKVMLIAYNAGDAFLMDRMRSGGDVDPDAPIPVIGDYTPAGETVADEDGKFRIAADSQTRISRVMAYHPPRYFLAVTGVTKPREDLLLELPAAGRFVGTVVDDETNRPVHGATIDIYFQQRVNKAPDKPGNVEFKTIQRKARKLDWLATLGRFIPKVLGPKLYGLPYEGRETIRLRSDRNGHFEIGPLADAMQLEFVITHPKYSWFDFDSQGGKTTPKRTVVEPGETVEREFRMRKGEFVAGRVVDENGKGVPNVLIEVQSISAYYRHWVYKHKWRRVMTDKEGRFRAEGLARGSQSIVAKHDTFGSVVESADAGTDGLEIVVEPLGGVRGRVLGAAGAKANRRIQVIFEATDEKTKGPRRFKKQTRIDKNSEFVLAGIAPANYRVWIKAGKESSMPQDVSVGPGEVAQTDFEIGGGGTIITRVFDTSGGIIDPATVRLIAIVNDRERPMGTFVSREGEISIDGIAPGLYRLEATSSGRIAFKTDRFEVSRDRSTVIPPIELREWGFLKFGQPVDETGRPARVVGNMILEVREGEKGAFRRILLSTGAELAVRPGPVDVRARMGETTFEERIQVEDGRSHDVRIVFPSR